VREESDLDSEAGAGDGVVSSSDTGEPTGVLSTTGASAAGADDGETTGASPAPSLDGAGASTAGVLDGA